VTADGVPVWGPITAGHGRDSTEPRCHSTQLRQHLPGLGEPLWVADSTCFAGETVALAATHRFRFVTLVPQTGGLRQKVVGAPDLGALPLLWEQPGRRTGQLERYHGTSVVRPSRWKTETGEVPERTWRFLVVESPPLATAQAPRLAAAQPTARATLATLQPQWQRRACACKADAHQAATLCLRELARQSHHLTYTVAPAWGPTKRATRGRPPKGSPRPPRQLWRVRWPGQEATEALATQAQRERRFVLATKVLDAQQLMDAALLQAYKGQPAVALRFKWAKNPAASAPIFLETPTRIAALGGVSLMALLVYTRIERHVRNSLRERGETRPDRPVPSQRPTARTVFQLRRTMAVVTLMWAGPRYRHVTTLSPLQLHVISLLGYGDLLSALPYRNAS
jgi:transposase